jgi:hypothetical protein
VGSKTLHPLIVRKIQTLERIQKKTSARIVTCGAAARDRAIISCGDVAKLSVPFRYYRYGRAAQHRSFF